MANQASKKREQTNASFNKAISGVFIFVICWFLLVKYVFIRSFPISKWSWFWFAFQLLIQYGCYQWLAMCMETTPWNEAIKGYSFDIYGLSVLISIFSPFSNKWIYCYLIIIFAVLYIGGKKVVDWVFTPNAAEIEQEQSENDPKLQKKLRKQELKEKRGTIRYRQ
ncbi:hypothetical protein WA158_006001 [Blastocystis sp. Blastoise]